LDKALDARQSDGMPFEETSANLARNLRDLREARGLSQAQMARQAGVPRATWSHLESGSGNPTLAVLLRVASSMQITVEELLGAPRSEVRLVKRDALPGRVRGPVRIDRILPDAIPGVLVERMDFQPDGVLVGIPHTAGAREFLTCASGRIALTVQGSTWTLEEGDVVVFQGDQRHSYRNLGSGQATAYAVISLG